MVKRTVEITSTGKRKTGIQKGERDFAFVLRGAGYRATPTRRAILNVLSRMKKPVSLDELWRRVGTKKIDQATIYRSVNDFAESGIVRRVDAGHQHAHYELADDHHHHLICTVCGTTEDVHACNIKPIEAKALKNSKHFKRIDTHSLELFGLCRACAH